MSQDALSISYALDTFYFLISGAFVMWMAAGFAMLEAGLVRSKNTAEILTKNVALFAIACVMFMLFGYKIMYPGVGVNSFWPGFGFLIGAENEIAAVTGGEDTPYYSARADFFFQVVFVATAMSIVSGAVAERMKLWAFLLFTVFLTAFIYPVQGYWNWGGGFLSGKFNYFDYAGSGTVHLCGAVAAFVGVKLLGARKGKYDKNGNMTPIPGANLPLATLGTFILWMGWFGFNGGSELKVSNIERANNVAQVFVNTNMAAAAGVVGALLVAKLKFGKADLTMVLNGALAGLVAITASPLSPSVLMASLIGLIGGVIVVFSIITFDRFRIDDPVGAISVHGVAGIWGILAVVLTNSEANIVGQLVGILAIVMWTALTSFIIWFAIKKTMGLRVSEQEEYEGVDLSECGLDAYPEFVN